MRKTPWPQPIVHPGGLFLILFLFITSYSNDLTVKPVKTGNTITEKTRLVEKEIFERTNKIRTESGKKQLNRYPLLDKVALEHSLDMIRRDFFAHVNPDGLTPTDRAKAAGYKPKRSLKDRTYITKVSENIGKMPTGMVLYRGHVEDTPESVAAALVKSWMARPGHRANILQYYSIRTGIGVAWDGKFYVATQLFH